MDFCAIYEKCALLRGLRVRRGLVAGPAALNRVKVHGVGLPAQPSSPSTLLVHTKVVKVRTSQKILNHTQNTNFCTMRIIRPLYRTCSEHPRFLYSSQHLAFCPNLCKVWSHEQDRWGRSPTPVFKIIFQGRPMSPMYSGWSESGLGRPDRGAD